MSADFSMASVTANPAAMLDNSISPSEFLAKVKLPLRFYLDELRAHPLDAAIDARVNPGAQCAFFHFRDRIPGVHAVPLGDNWQSGYARMLFG
jgi:hypothetical protein